jgi:hypothetical protein
MPPSSRRPLLGGATALVNGIADAMLQGTAQGDLRAAERRVAALRHAHPDAGVDELVRRTIAKATRSSALVGAATSGAAIVPGLGTIAALTLGSAIDVGATLRLQTKVVLDIALLRGVTLDPAQARAAVMLVAGVSRAGTLALHGAGRAAVRQMGMRAGSRWLLRAVPVLGLIGTSGSNAVATELIGRRADAFFARGPEALDDWREGVAAATGLDARPLLRRLAEARRPRPEGDAPPP